MTEKVFSKFLRNQYKTTHFSIDFQEIKILDDSGLTIRFSSTIFDEKFTKIVDLFHGGSPRLTVFSKTPVEKKFKNKSMVVDVEFTKIRSED